MKKEKQVRSYKRRTKSGKIITVKAHTAKYDAADEKAKDTSKKEGAGKELEERKKKSTKLEIPLNKEEEKKVLDEVKDEEKKSSSKKSAPTKPSAIHLHDMYEYSTKDKKRMNTLLPKIDKMQKDWENKYGSRANSPAAERHLKKLNSLESEYQKLLNSSKKETSAYSKYKKDFAEWNKYNKKQEAASKKEEKQKYMNMAEKKGLSYVGTKGGSMVFHKNGKPYIAEYGKITSLNVPKTIKDYVSKKSRK